MFTMLTYLYYVYNHIIMQGQMASPNLIPVLIKETCIGHLLRRDLQWEAFDVNDRSHGLHASPATAVEALIAVASKPPEAA
jgi:hypothetical protein